MNHCCPACGKSWLCTCTLKVRKEHAETFGEHPEEIACSLKCAYQLAALVKFLARQGVR